MENKRKIIQIMPANGWAAAYIPPKWDQKNYMYSPLVCWALVQEQDGSTRVRGIDTDAPGGPLWGNDAIVFCDEGNNFAGYEKFNNVGKPFEAEESESP